MAGFNTQFHATLSELQDFIESWLDEHPIVISAFAFPPRSRVAISRETVREVLARPDVLQVTFTHGPVDSSLRSAGDVVDAGYKPLYLLIRRLKPHGLEQSSLSTGYDDPIWKKINRDLKRRTTAGADYANDETGASHFYREPRFTPGAKALYASGTPLLQLGGKGSSFRPK
jgi:hypothetical protein